jgi:hypothetical protein
VLLPWTQVCHGTPPSYNISEGKTATGNGQQVNPRFRPETGAATLPNCVTSTQKKKLQHQSSVKALAPTPTVAGLPWYPGLPSAGAGVTFSVSRAYRTRGLGIPSSSHCLGSILPRPVSKSHQRCQETDVRCAQRDCKHCNHSADIIRY